MVTEGEVRAPVRTFGDVDEGAMAQLRACMADPDAAYEASKKYVEGLAQADEATQKQVLAASIEMWKADRPGFSDPAAWQNMNEVLVKAKLMPAPIEVNKAFTNEFVP